MRIKMALRLTRPGITPKSGDYLEICSQRSLSFLSRNIRIFPKDTLRK